MTELDALAANSVRRVNVGDMLTRTAWRLPDKEAVVDGPRRLTYAQLDATVNRLAHGLLRAGFGRGDVLALASGSSLEFLLVYYACAKTGVVCVPVNLAWGPDEVAYVLEHSRARAVVVESQLVSLVERALERAVAHEVAEVFVAPGTGVAWAPGPVGTWQDLEVLGTHPDASEPRCLVEDRDPLSYLYTSGTTSAPKGVVSSHVAVYIESLNGPARPRVSPRAIARW